jgi:hypothetical protein
MPAKAAVAVSGSQDDDRSRIHQNQARLGWRTRSLSTVRTLFSIIVAGAVSASVAQAQTAGEKAAEAWDQTKQTAKAAGHAVAKTTKKAANAVADALTPDSDARRVDVTLAEDRIDMPTSAEPVKTAFVVKNDSKEKRNFEIQGRGIDRKFLAPVGAGETKVLHVNLKPGTYSAYSVQDGKRGAKTKLTVH